MKINRHLDHVHPVLADVANRIERDVIQKHCAPFKLFETSRDNERHTTLLQRGKTKDVVSMHLFNLENDPPLYCTALDYVYYVNKWSWNMRDATVIAWYELFGNLVLDACPELIWGGMSRKSKNYNHFELRQSVIFDNMAQIPCVTRQ